MLIGGLSYTINYFTKYNGMSDEAKVFDGENVTESNELVE